MRRRADISHGHPDQLLLQQQFIQRIVFEQFVLEQLLVIELLVVVQLFEFLVLELLLVVVFEQFELVVFIEQLELARVVAGTVVRLRQGFSPVRQTAARCPLRARCTLAIRMRRYG